MKQNLVELVDFMSLEIPINTVSGSTPFPQPLLGWLAGWLGHGAIHLNWNPWSAPRSAPKRGEGWGTGGLVVALPVAPHVAEEDVMAAVVSPAERRFEAVGRAGLGMPTGGSAQQSQSRPNVNLPPIPPSEGCNSVAAAAVPKSVEDRMRPKAMEQKHTKV